MNDDDVSLAARATRRSARNATYAVVDVETTGFDARVDRVVEVACAIVHASAVASRFSSLIDPQRDIPAAAKAVHGISARDVAGAPTLETVAPLLGALCSDAVVVGHNVGFDLRFLPFLAHRPRLCTVRLAMHVFSGAPNYKNQTLRRYLSLDGDEPAGMAHRAAADVEITARLLLRGLEHYTRTNDDDLDALLATLRRPLGRRP